MELQQHSEVELNLAGIKIAILIADGFHQTEFFSMKEFLARSGATVKVVSPEVDKVRGINIHGRCDAVPVDVRLQNARETDFDALVLPGGRINASALLSNRHAIEFVRAFVIGNKPIAAMSHAPLLFIKADTVTGKRLTSEPSIRGDLKNAGADWVSKEIVVYENLVTSPGLDDCKDFNFEFGRLCSQQKDAVGPSLHTD